MQLETEYTSIKNVIAIKCMDCCCGDLNEVSQCTSTNCPLLLLRPTKRKVGLKDIFWDSENNCLKKLPIVKQRIMSEEQKLMAKQRMDEMRQRKQELEASES